MKKILSLSLLLGSIFAANAQFTNTVLSYGFFTNFVYTNNLYWSNQIYALSTNVTTTVSGIFELTNGVAENVWTTNDLADTLSTNIVCYALIPQTGIYTINWEEFTTLKPPASGPIDSATYVYFIWTDPYGSNRVSAALNTDYANYGIKTPYEPFVIGCLVGSPIIVSNYVLESFDGTSTDNVATNHVRASIWGRR